MKRTCVPLRLAPWAFSSFAVACTAPEQTPGAGETEDDSGASSGTSPGTSSDSDLPDTDTASPTSATNTTTDAGTDDATGTGDADSGSDDTSGGATCDVTEVALPGEAFFPEGIAADDGLLYVGSLATGEIVVADPCRNTVETLLAPGGPIRNAVGLRVDPSRSLLWVCNSDITYTSPPSLDALDLQTGQRVAEHQFDAIGFCNDIAIDDAGNVYATDSAGHRLHRVAAEDALSDTITETWLADASFAVRPGAFGLNGITLDADNAVWFSNYQLGTLHRVLINADGSPGAIETPRLAGATSLPDGLLWHEDSLLTVSGGNALLRVQPEAPFEVTVLADDLDFGTTVAVTHGDAWVAEGQLDHLFGIDPNPPTQPFVVRRIAL